MALWVLVSLSYYGPHHAYKTKRCPVVMRNGDHLRLWILKVLTFLLVQKQFFFQRSIWSENLFTNSEVLTMWSLSRKPELRGLKTGRSSLTAPRAAGRWSTSGHSSSLLQAAGSPRLFHFSRASDAGQRFLLFCLRSINYSMCCCFSICFHILCRHLCPY